MRFMTVKFDSRKFGIVLRVDAAMEGDGYVAGAAQVTPRYEYVVDDARVRSPSSCTRVLVHSDTAHNSNLSTPGPPLDQASGSAFHDA